MVATFVAVHKEWKGSADIEMHSVVFSEQDFDEYAVRMLPQLLDRATLLVKRYLRETGQRGKENVVHEKLTQRWAYELVERFLNTGRTQVPCRPLQLLDSFSFKCFSQPSFFSLNSDSSSPLDRFLHGLLSTAVYSRDAMAALFYHLYGLGQLQAAMILALESVESQRIYKNYVRWRTTGWYRMVEEVGLKEQEIRQLENHKRRCPIQFQAEVERLLGLLQSHYRKSEPAHYPCLSPDQWRQMYEENYGHDYRRWHLALCRHCFAEVWRIEAACNGYSEPELDLRLRPLQK